MFTHPKAFLTLVDQLCDAPSSVQLMLDEFVESGDFKNCMNLLSDSDIQKIADRSTVHSVGFNKIKLVSYNGWNMRLHIWENRDYVQEHEPHSHRWTLISKLLMGTADHFDMRETGKEGSFMKYLAHGTKIGGKRKYEKVGPADLELVKQSQYKAGESYNLDYTVPHVVKVPANTRTATLFITTPPKSDTSNVYMPDLGDCHHSHKFEKMTPKLVKEKIQSVF